MLCEAAHLLSREQGGRERFRAFLAHAPLEVTFSWASRKGRVAELMETYADTPMDSADVCLVVFYEAQLGGETVVLTTDDDFRIYRTTGGEAPDVLMPPT